jgi:hypothetical protein
MILLKIAITVIVVTTLSLIAEHISPRAAGILSGYPLGSAIALFFIGVEQGAVFAGQSAIYNVAGLAALLFFMFVYYLVSRSLPSRLAKAVIIAAASVAANLAFFGLDAFLHAMSLPAWGCVLVAAAAILGFGGLFRGIPNAQIAQRIRLGPGVLIFRAALATLVILAITGAAHLVPPAWAGLFSAYPATVFPLLLILHSTYGAEQAHTVIKNLPTGLWALFLYSLTISFAYPRLGVYWGTLVGFAAATVYLLALAAFSQRAR